MRFQNLSQEQRERLEAAGATVLEPPELDRALVGVSDACEAVYSYGGLVRAFCDLHGGTLGEAVEWMEYNTIRALPYMPEPRPVIKNDMS